MASGILCVSVFYISGIEPFLLWIGTFPMTVRVTDSDQESFLVQLIFHI